MKKNLNLKIRLTEEDLGKLDEIRGKQTRSEFIRVLVNRSAAGHGKGVDQFVELLKNIEGVTKIAGTLERIEKKVADVKTGGGTGSEPADLKKITVQVEKISENLKKMVDGINTMIKNGAQLIKEKMNLEGLGGGGGQQFGEVQIREMLRKEIYKPLHDKIAEGNMQLGHLQSDVKAIKERKIGK